MWWIFDARIRHICLYYTGLDFLRASSRSQPENENISVQILKKDTDCEINVFEDY